MVFRQFSPSKALSAYIKCYWVLEADHYPGPPERILPDGCCELIFHYGDKYTRLSADGFTEQPPGLLVGQIKTAIQLQATGKTGMFAIRFHPWGLTPFTGTPANEFTDQHISANILFAGIDELREQFHFSGSHERMVLQAEAFLSGLLEKQHLKCFYDAGRFGGIIPEMTKNISSASVKAMAGMANMGERQFNRKFSEVTGLSPKHFIRIARLQGFISSYRQVAEPSLSGLIYEHGYYDPAHFSHDFKSIAGINPSEYFAELDGLGSAMLL